MNQETERDNSAATTSGGGLLKSVLIALIAAVVVAVLFILPAEYGVDPTGIGSKLGLLDLAATEDQSGDVEPRMVTGAFPDIPTDFDYYEPEVFGDPFSRIHDSDFRSDTLTIELDVVEAVEYKAIMQQGDALVYSWRVNKGKVYTDYHADPAGSDAYPEGYWVRYSEGELEGSSGSLVAPFAGNHGWYWLNIEEEPITITLELRGFYESVDEVMRGKQ